jgi:hypoxanthine-guanine phosphoribosyltransferase
MLSNQQARDILNSAEMLLSEEQVNVAVRHVAQEINATLADHIRWCCRSWEGR